MTGYLKNDTQMQLRVRIGSGDQDNSQNDNFTMSTGTIREIPGDVTIAIQESPLPHLDVADHDEALLVAEAMRDSGGSFVKALGEMLLHADPNNLLKIREAFPTYYSQYKTLALAKKEAPGEGRQMKPKRTPYQRWKDRENQASLTAFSQEDDDAADDQETDRS